METLQVRKRNDPRRCALCHDDLAGAHVECGVCGTVLHEQCRSTLEACPTLGCSSSRPTTTGPYLGVRGELALAFAPSIPLWICALAFHEVHAPHLAGIAGVGAAILSFVLAVLGVLVFKHRLARPREVLLGSFIVTGQALFTLFIAADL